MNEVQQPIKINTIDTPIGLMVCGVYDDSLCLLEFEDRRMLQTQIKRIQVLFQGNIINKKTPIHDLVQTQISEYFTKKRTIFELPILAPGTQFQEKVWQELLNIPYGKTRSYQEQSELINNPKAIRAVARANGDNRIAIIIPCHRIIGSNGEMTGYGGKIWRKKYLLELEGAIAKQQQLF